MSVNKATSALSVAKALQNATKGDLRFNATLPIRLQVLEKLSGVRYMLKVGNQMLETKSQQELNLGGNYWANMSRTSAGAISLSNLIAQPKLLKEANLPLKLDAEAIAQFLKESSNPFEALRDFLAQKMSEAQSKWEFAFLSHMLLSLKNGVLSLPLGYDDESKNGFLQMKKRKKGAQNELEFYAVFANLGSSWGVLRDFSDGLRLDLRVLYESVARLLERNLDELEGIKHIEISVDKSLVPLYEFSDNLLNLVG